MTVFTLSPKLEKHWYPFNVIEDMWADVKHMIGINTPDCTVSDNDHTLRGHLADLGIDALRLLPAAIIVALAVAGFMVLPVFGINGNQPNTGLAPNAPVIVPPVSNADEPLVWPATPTLTPTNTPTPTPTMTPSPTPTPVVFVSEEECDYIPPELVIGEISPLAIAHSSFSRFLDGKEEGKEIVEQYLTSKDHTGNWFNLETADFPAGLPRENTYALPRADWEPFLDSNRYCQVNGQWMPLPPYEDLRLVSDYPPYDSLP